MRISFLVFLLSINTMIAQSFELSIRNIIKDGTQINYVVAELYKTTGLGSKIKERSVLDTLRYQFKNTENDLQVLCYENELYKGKKLIKKNATSFFFGILDADLSQLQNEKFNFTLSPEQFALDSIYVSEQVKKQIPYYKSTEKQKFSFLLNARPIYADYIIYKEATPNNGVNVDLGFLDNNKFPIQTHKFIIINDNKSFRGFVFRLVSINFKTEKNEKNN